VAVAAGPGRRRRDAAAFLIAFNLRSAEIRPEFFAVPGWPILIVLLTWYVSAELVDGYRLVTTVNPRAAFSTAASALTLSFVALLGVFFIVPYRITRPTLLLWVPVAAALVLSWRIAYLRIFAQAIFAGNLLVIAEGARKKLSYDLYYIRRQGFGLDLLILARTARTVVSFRGR
jgi:hypothetical protein